ncbi:MAG: hypothetical protein AB1505_12395 [Candidatus Latescibacterota bacterium]
MALALLAGASPVTADPPLRLRQEYNEVAAAIDTLVRQGGRPVLEALTRSAPAAGVLPAGHELVLVFWADDEAEVTLNGYPVARTRLTPTQVVVPPLYLGRANRLQAHCWDTDRVESGFMAGLYLRDEGGALRPVLATGTGPWQADGVPAQERYYTHPQPQIPGAVVIWGTQLFGEVHLQADFGAGALRRAAGAAPVAPVPGAGEQAMEAHALVNRLLRLQARRQELSAALGRAGGGGPSLRYEGFVRDRLVFTLGRAGPLSEAESAPAARQLHAWAQGLPEEQRELVLRPPRALKGVGAATPGVALEPTTGGSADRRTDYQPPPEHGPGAQGATGTSLAVARLRRALDQRRLAWELGVAVAGLALYVGLALHAWWRVCQRGVWRA